MSKDSIARNNLWKWLALLLIAVGSAYLTFPIKDKIRLGLDLKGGSSFTLGVDDVRLRDKISEEKPECATDEKAMQEEIARRLDDRSDDRIVEIVRRRVDAMGTNEPLIQPIKGKHQIVVQLPGADQATRDAARDRLEKMAYLEFRLVPQNESLLLSKLPATGAPPGFIREGSCFRRAPDWTTVSQGSNYVTRLSAWGAGSSVEPVRFILQPDEKDRGLYRPRFVSRKALLTGADLAEASVSSGEGLNPGYCVNFRFKPQGAEKFSKLTRENVGRNLAIILDDELVSAPVIKSEIGESGQITGNFKLEEAKRLASDLNAGALPAPLKIQAESTVDPTVGVDAIARGKWAALIGFALVAVFMLFYYWYVGCIADIALFLDVVLLPAALFLVANILGVFVSDPSMEGSKFQLPVLTMPGIAGLVLTLGMAVDANVLIFERIREEFTRGASVGEAVEKGYARAFTSIFDSNLTTIITGAILYSVGTGPVRGFAIILTGGVVISMFTAVVVTRLLIDHTSDPDSGKAFKMRQFFTAPKIDFMKYGNKTLAASAIIIVLTLGLFGYRLMTNPGQVLAVDLTGGTSIIYSLETKDDGKAPTESEIRKALDSIDNAMVIQFQGEKLLLKTGITSDSGTTLTYTLTADDVSKYELQEKPTASKLLDKIDVNHSVNFDAATKTVVVKVSETSASGRGKQFVEGGSSVAEKVTGIMTRGGNKFGCTLVEANEVLGVETQIEQKLNATFPQTVFKAESHETVGSMVGADLRESGTKAVCFSLIAILIYVGFRFRFGFGLGGLVALAHDALISLGIYSLLGHQVSLIVITALLTIIGYSINDTVVVFDRIREQLKYDKRSSFYDLCNKAINDCLSRTVITSVTTFFAVAALFIFGEGSIYDFALTMLIGVVAGTYSSVFVATPIMAWWYKGKRPDFDDEEEKSAQA